MQHRRWVRCEVVPVCVNFGMGPDQQLVYLVPEKLLVVVGELVHGNLHEAGKCSHNPFIDIVGDGEDKT